MKKEVYYLLAIAIVAISAIETVAIMHGIDGKVLAGVIAAISFIAGLAIPTRKRKDKDKDKEEGGD